MRHSFRYLPIIFAIFIFADVVTIVMFLWYKLVYLNRGISLQVGCYLVVLTYKVIHRTEVKKKYV